MKITLAQLNPTIGDIKGNLNKLKNTISAYTKDKPDLFIFPELFISGYPPRDLLERSWFIQKIDLAIKDILEYSKNFPEIGILFGAPLKTNKPQGRGLYNSAVLVNKNKPLLRSVFPGGVSVHPD